MGLTTKDVPVRPELTQKEIEFWNTYWLAGSFAAEKMSKLARVMSMAAQLQMYDVGFDIHISNIVPHISGGITSSSGGHNFFHSLDDLVAILENTVAWVKGEVASE